MSVTFDQSRLNKAVADRLNLLSSSRTPQQIVDTAAFWIAVNARKATPFSTIASIDQGLSVSTSPKLFKSGKPMKRAKVRAYGPLGAAARVAKNANIPLAILIIQARATLGSRYNQLTGDRWYSAYSPFYGVSRQEGAALMKAAIDKLVSTRHSSPHYLGSAWLAAQRALYPFAVRSWGRGSSSASDAGTVLDSSVAARGYAQPAGSGMDVRATIENLTGMIGPQAQKQNAALLKYGEPAMQDAVDKEESQLVDYTQKAMAKGNYAFNAFAAL